MQLLIDVVEMISRSLKRDTQFARDFCRILPHGKHMQNLFLLLRERRDGVWSPDYIRDGRELPRKRSHLAQKLFLSPLLGNIIGDMYDQAASVVLRISVHDDTDTDPKAAP